MEWLTDPGFWASLVTLTALEIVLGVDNLVFMAILVGRLPPEQRKRARQLGLMLALVSRLALLAALVWLIRLTRPLFDVFGHAVSWRDIVLTAGGLFLLYSGTREIHHALESAAPATKPAGSRHARFAATVLQIMLLDIVFSLDSVITAIGLASILWVMAAAIIIAVLIMLWGSGPLADFVERHSTVRMLALSFLILIGMTLVADGAGFHVPKGYIYAAIGFSLAVEVLNQLAARRRKRPGRRRLRSGSPIAPQRRVRRSC